MDDVERIGAARAIVDIAGHFDRLKITVLAFRDAFETQDRGFFSPSEEEEVQHLLGAYWQGRAALYEILYDMRGRWEDSGSEAIEDFVVGYAAALILLDAARFLRNVYHDDDIVVDKLNEGVESLGVPPRFYDQLQKSLTDPAQAWGLYRATQFWERHGNQARSLASENSFLAGPIQVIEGRIESVRVRKRDYFAARVANRARRVQDLMQRSTLGRAFYALEELVGCAIAEIHTRPRHTPSLPDHVRAELLKHMQPGDVLICRKEHVLSNYFLPGFWPHAALFLGDEDALRKLGHPTDSNASDQIARFADLDTTHSMRVLEAQKDGVLLRSITSCFGCDAILVLRPQLPDDQIATAIGRAFQHVDKPYDFDFDFTRSDRMVCTEVIYRAYEGPIPFELTKRAGRMTLAPEELVTMARIGQGFVPVAGYCEGFADRTVSGAQICDLVAWAADQG